MATATKSTKTRQELADGDSDACDLITRHFLKCPRCGENIILLTKGGSWGCPYGMDHTRLKPSDSLQKDAEDLIPFDGTPDKYRVRGMKKIKVAEGRDVQLKRIMKELETRCGWHMPRWSQHYLPFNTKRAKHGDGLCVLRIGKWFAAYAPRRYDQQTREGFWDGDVIDIRRMMQWEKKDLTISKATVRVVYSPFDHTGSVEKAIREAGIVIL